MKFLTKHSSPGDAWVRMLHVNHQGVGNTTSISMSILNKLWITGDDVFNRQVVVTGHNQYFVLGKTNKHFTFGKCGQHLLVGNISQRSVVGDGNQHVVHGGNCQHVVASESNHIL